MAPRDRCAYNAHGPEGSASAQALAGATLDGEPKVRPVSVFIECCCSPKSLLSEEAQRKHITKVRFTKDSHDLGAHSGFLKAKREILQHIKNGEKNHIWASLPCKAWSKRNVFNASRLGLQIQSIFARTQGGISKYHF